MRAPLPRALADRAASAGYGDRLALVAAAGLAAAGEAPIWLPLAYLSVLAVTVVAGVAQARELPGATRYLGAAAVLFAVDALATATAIVLQVTGRRPQWRSPRALQGTHPTDAPAPVGDV
jgi:hypothetical protein